MVAHPPMLYTGYVVSVASRSRCRAPAAGSCGVRWSRPWTTVAWGFLTLDHDRELVAHSTGRGGWWFWDQCERVVHARLVGTALPLAAVTEKRARSAGRCCSRSARSRSLVGVPGALGVLTSVHAFATDPARRVHPRSS
jgi:cytochrome c-type biogenesis protein CcmF